MEAIDDTDRRLRRLLIRPAPYPDEAIVGYLCRLSNSNGFTGLRELHRYVLAFGEGDAKYGVATAAGVPLSQIQRLLGPYPSYWHVVGNLAGLATADFNQQTLRWCPECLREAPYLRSSWTTKLVCHCPRHHRRLLDRCPACGSVVRLAKGAFPRCVCGEKLAASAQQDALSSSEAKLLDRLHGAIERAERNFTVELSAASLIRLIRYLGQFEDGQAPERPGQLGDLHELDVARKVFSRAAVLLDDWPTNFNQLLAATLQNRPVSPSLKMSFGRLYRLIYKDLEAPCFGFVREAFEGFIKDQWWGIICRRNRHLSRDALAGHPRLTLRQAAESLGVGEKVLRHLADASVVDVVQARTPKGRISTTIHKEQLDLIGDACASAVSLKTAAGILALPRRRLRELIDGGVIEPLLRRREVRASQWLIPTSELDRLNHLPGTACGEEVSINQVLKNWRLGQGEFPELVRAIESGAVSLAAAKGGSVFGERMCCRGSVLTWRKVTLQGRSTFSVDEAAAELGVKQQVVYALVRSGLIKTVGSHKPVRIDRDALASFRHDYVSLAMLAKLRKTSPRRLLGELEAAPVCGPTVDGCRQYFFLRADLKGRT